MVKAQRPSSASAAQCLMLVLGGAWLSIGILIIWGAHPAMHIAWPWNWLTAGLLTVAALVAFGLAFALARRSRLGFYGGLAFLAASALAVIFDQVGWVDAMFAAVNILGFVLLLRARHWYLGA